MFKYDSGIAACVYALLWFAFCSSVPMVASAQSAIVNTHKPFTLKVRYGANADPAEAGAEGNYDTADGDGPPPPAPSS